ncbi:hypothetical protein O3654_02200 [Pauljensenia sp. 20925_1_91]
MDWSSWISACAAVLSALGGGFAYYQAQFSKNAKTDAAQEREMAERAEQRAIEVAEATKLHLEAIDKQTAIFREQASQLEAIAKALRAGTPVADIGFTISQHPSLEKRSRSTFALVNNRDVPLSIERVRNRDQFLRIDLDNRFDIEPHAQKTFIAVGALGHPLPDNLSLDEVGEDQPLNIPIPID